MQTTTISQSSTAAGRHLIRVALQHLQLPWLNIQPAIALLGIKAATTQQDTIQLAPGSIFMQDNIPWTLQQKIKIPALNISDIKYQRSNNRLSITISTFNKVPISPLLQNNITLYFSGNDALQATWILLKQTKTTIAYAICNELKINLGRVNLQHAATCMLPLAKNIHDETTTEFSAYNSISDYNKINEKLAAIEIKGPYQKSCPELCHNIEIVCQLDIKSKPWPKSISHHNTFLSVAAVAQLAQQASEPWNCSPGQASYCINPAENTQITDVIKLTSYHNNHRIQWQKHSPTNKMQSFIAYPVDPHSKYSAWIIELEPIPQQALCMSAELTCICNTGEHRPETWLTTLLDKDNIATIGYAPSKIPQQPEEVWLAWLQQNLFTLQGLKSKLAPFASTTIFKEQIAALKHMKTTEATTLSLNKLQQQFHIEISTHPAPATEPEWFFVARLLHNLFRVTTNKQVTLKLHTADGAFHIIK